MPSRHAASLALLVTAWTAQAQAAPATPEEAQRLTALFERYVGHPGGEASAVTVTPDGDSYRMALDGGRLLGFLQQDGLAVSVAPFAARLTPQTDGRWRVAIDGLPGLGFTKAGQATSVTINGYKLDGLFDPALQAFASASTQASGSTAHTSGPQGSSTAQLTETSLGSYGATDGGAGTIDVKASQTIKDFTYDIDVAPAAEASDSRMQPFKLAIRGASLASSLSLGNVRNVALNDLWAFLVAHGSKDDLVAHQVELKTRLKALLPLASSAVGDVSLSKLVVSTSLGAFGAAELSEHYEFDGPTEKSGVVSTLKASGLSLPEGLVPDWAAPLTPTGLDVTQVVGPLDVTPSLLMAIDGADLAADKPLTDAQLAAIKKSLAQGDGRVRIAPSSLSTALMTVRFQSDLKLARSLPTGTASVSVTGLDKTIDAIRAASPDDPNAAQVIAMLSAVKVLAKAEGADSYSWHVEAAPGGDVKVNGTPLNMGAPKPSEGKAPAMEP